MYMCLWRAHFRLTQSSELHTEFKSMQHVLMLSTTCNRKQRQDNTYGQGTHTCTMYIKIEKIPIKKYRTQSSTFGRQQLVRLEKNFRILLSSFLMPPDESVAAAGTSVAAAGTSVAAAGTSVAAAGTSVAAAGVVCGCSGGRLWPQRGRLWPQRGRLWPQRGRLQCRQNTRTFHWWPLWSLEPPQNAREAKAGTSVAAAGTSVAVAGTSVGAAGASVAAAGASVAAAGTSVGAAGTSAGVVRTPGHFTGGPCRV